MSYRKLTEKEKQHLTNRIDFALPEQNKKLIKSDKIVNPYTMNLIDYHLKSAIELYELELSSKHER